MQITTALSTEIDLEEACRGAAAEAMEAAGGAEIDLCLLFVSGAYGSKVTAAPSLITELVDPTRLVGCVAGGIIGNGVEIEGMPAVSVSLLSIPGAEIEVVHLIEQDLPNDDLGPQEWVRLVTTPPDEATGIILLPDPFSFPTDRLLRGLDFAYPGVSKVGGLVSGSAHPGGNALFVDQTIYHEGAIAMVFSGNVVLETVVAQGCKPFGKIGRLTKIRDNLIYSIDDVPAMQFLQDQLEDLSAKDLDLARSTPLFLGIAMDPFATTEPEHGDYLIRNMVGYDPQAGSLAVGAEIGLGRRVQFHLRDGECSSKDLEAVLEQGIHDGRLADPRTRGALLFSCLGRGEHLYGRPNHDSDMFQRVVGRMPLSGFFCNGEIGPVQGSTYLHGYTSAFGVLREKEKLNSRVLTLVKSWLVIDFFADSRKSGEPGSSLTSTIFTQSFIGLLFAAVFLPELHGFAVAYLAANLSLSTGLIGIGMLGEPKRQKREQADELLVRTAPMPAGSLTMARALHSSFSLALVTTGMAIPPAILAYWVCEFSLVAVPLYLLMATVVAAFMAAALAIFTRFVFLTMGPARSQLVAGTLKATLLGGGLVGFAICLPHMDQTADQLPIGRTGAMMWPPYWAARVIDQPWHAGVFWLLIVGLAIVLFLAATALNGMQRNRVQRSRPRPGILSAVDRALTREGPLLGVTRFVATMLFRSPGFRARVLPLFGIPAGMVMLSLWDTDDPRARALLLGMTLQAPAIGMPFLVTFLPRSDHENAGWIFRTSPHREMKLYRTASLVALTTHLLLPIQVAACLGLLAASSWTLSEVLFAVTMPMFSLGLGVFVTEICLSRLTTAPFTNDSDVEEGAMEFGGLTAIAILLALLGGAFSVLASNAFGILIAAALAVAAIQRLRGNCRVALTA